MIYARCLAAELLARNILFYEHTYIVLTTTNGWGKLVPTSAPPLTSPQWPIPDTSSVALTSSRIRKNVQNAMKCTYGSHRATITCYMPIHIFVHFLHASDTHCTPTMWISKGKEALSHFLSPAWDSKIVQHNGDTIKCSVMVEKVVVRYHIVKQ